MEGKDGTGETGCRGGNCSICGVHSAKACSVCSKIYYCSVEHQRQDWRRHKKEECLASKELKLKSYVEETRDDILGNHLIASRDIKPGMHVLTDWPILIGPTGSLPEFAKLCLACSKVCESDYRCSNCTWPMCGVSCEKESLHADNECTIFKENAVLPEEFQNGNVYGDIQLIRALLLKNKCEESWKSLMSMESHVEGRRSADYFVSKVRQQCKFIKEDCKLDVDIETIDYLSGVLAINTFEPRCVTMLPVPSNFRCESRVYPNLSKISHQCISNVKVIDCKTGKNGGVTLVATVPIKKGEPLIQYYGNPELGTRQRQRMQKSAYFFSCKCKRCVDPTELDTYFSAVKCKNPNCPGGYLLPSDPLDLELDWKCNQGVCGETIPSKEIDKITEDVVEKVQQIRTELDAKKEYFRLNPSKGTEFLNLMEERLKASCDFIHPNHFALFPLKECIMEVILATDKPFGDTAIALWLGEKLEKYAKDCLKVYDIFFPGLTPERGKYMYFLASAMSCCITARSFLHPGRQVLYEQTLKCHEVEELALAMLSGMPEGSEAASMCEMLKFAIFATGQMLSSLLRN